MFRGLLYFGAVGVDRSYEVRSDNCLQEEGSLVSAQKRECFGKKGLKPRLKTAVPIKKGSGSGFRVQGSGFRVQGLGFRV